MFERANNSLSLVITKIALRSHVHTTRKSLEHKHSNVEHRYCQASERGGHTHFSTAKIKLKPNEGDLLVFSYLHVDGTNDYTRLSQHSGCPIREGEKIIATQWFRNDVSELKDWIAYRKDGINSTEDST